MYRRGLACDEFAVGAGMDNRSIAVVTGSLGLVGSAAVRRFDALGLDVVGIDNDGRRMFFGDESSTAPQLALLQTELPRYRHLKLDIRDDQPIDDLFRELGGRIAVVLHAAAQPSHDWAARAPRIDFAINATATLSLLESVRAHAPEALFLYMSSNKVYGDGPNQLPLRAAETRFVLPAEHPFAVHGIDETMPIDQCRHSLFGVSKTAADLMVQEYSSRFGLDTMVFRAGCITGPEHRAVPDHGFLAYLCERVAAGLPYTVVGYGGRQVRDNLHVDDLADAFAFAVSAPRVSGVYNIGGGPKATVSVSEALDLAGRLTGRVPIVELVDEPRYGDHMWWVSDFRRFQAAYPAWRPSHGTDDLIAALVDAQLARLAK